MLLWLQLLPLMLRAPVIHLLRLRQNHRGGDQLVNTEPLLIQSMRSNTKQGERVNNLFGSGAIGVSQQTKTTCNELRRNAMQQHVRIRSLHAIGIIFITTCLSWENRLCWLSCCLPQQRNGSAAMARPLLSRHSEQAEQFEKPGDGDRGGQILETVSHLHDDAAAAAAVRDVVTELLAFRLLASLRYLS